MLPLCQAIVLNVLFSTKNNFEEQCKRMDINDFLLITYLYKNPGTDLAFFGSERLNSRRVLGIF